MRKKEEQTQRTVDVVSTSGEKQIKNVNVLNCVGMIVFSVIAFMIIFIPVVFGEGGPLTLAYKGLPLFGDGSFLSAGLDKYAAQFFTLFGLPTEILNTLSNVFAYFNAFGFYVYFGILIFNIGVSIALICSRSQILRLICRIFSLIFACVAIVMSIYLLFVFVGFFMAHFSGALPIADLWKNIQCSGILFILAWFIFSILMAVRQFKGYRKLYKE